MSIVSTNQNYGYNLLRRNLLALNRKYPFLNVQVVGNSVLGKSIYVVKLGHGSKKVFYSASFHANESITSILLMKFIEDYCIAYVNNSDLYDYSIRDLFNEVSIYIMPMVNPDGVDLVNGFLTPYSFGYQSAYKISTDFSSIPFPNGWKSNIRGVVFSNFQ